MKRSNMMAICFAVFVIIVGSMIGSIMSFFGPFITAYRWYHKVPRWLEIGRRVLNYVLEMSNNAASARAGQAGSAGNVRATPQWLQGLYIPLRAQWTPMILGVKPHRALSLEMWQGNTLQLYLSTKPWGDVQLAIKRLVLHEQSKGRTDGLLCVDVRKSRLLYNCCLVIALQTCPLAVE